MNYESGCGQCDEEFVQAMWEGAGSVFDMKMYRAVLMYMMYRQGFGCGGIKRCLVKCGNLDGYVLE